MTVRELQDLLAVLGQPDDEVIVGPMIDVPGTEDSVGMKRTVSVSTLFPIEGILQINVRQPQPKAYVAIGFTMERPINKAPAEYVN
jgi:hypothetical protein